MTDETEYIIFHDYREHMPEGETPKKWPMHITLASWYVLDTTESQEMIDTVQSIALNCTPFLFKAGEEAMFGPNNDTPVTLINDLEGMLSKLHITLLEDLGKIGCRFINSDSDWILSNFKPHITHMAGEEVPTCNVEFDSLTIASRNIRDHSKKLIEKVIPLANSLILQQANS